MTRRTPPARAPSSRLSRPSRLTSPSRTGSATEIRTSTWAAWWFSRVNPPVASSARACGERMSARTNRAPRGTFVIMPVDKSSSTVTSSPASTYAAATCDPMKPAPPVTSTRLLTEYPPVL